MTQLTEADRTTLQKKLHKAKTLMEAEPSDSKKYKAYYKKVQQYQDELNELDDEAARKTAEAVATSKQASTTTGGCGNDDDNNNGGGGEKVPAWKLRMQQGRGTGTTTAAPSAPTTKSSGNANKTSSSTSAKEIKILKKKLEKVAKMIDDTVFGSKEYDKLYKKQQQYTNELRDLEEDNKGATTTTTTTSTSHNTISDDEDDSSSDDHHHHMSDDDDDDEEDDNNYRKQQQQEEEDRQQRRLQAEEEEEEDRKRRQKEEEDRKRRQQQKEEEAEAAAAQEEKERRRKAAAAASAAAAKEEEESHMSEQERIRKQRVEDYRRQREEAKAAKEAEEKAAKEKAARHKEFVTFKKKLDKLDEMVDDLYSSKSTREEAESTDKYKKLQKKKQEYLDHLDEYDEWQEELVKRQAEEKRKEEARVRAEQERIRLEEERMAAEERERLEQERREREEREAAERAEKERLEAIEREQREAEERAAKEAQEKREAEERAAKEAQRRAEAEERARKEEEERKQRELERAEREAKRKAECEEKGIPYEPEDQMVSKDFMDRRSLQEPYSENTRKILRALEGQENRQGRLVKTLNQHGIPVSEEIPYEVAKDKIAEMQSKMKVLQESGEDEFTMQKKFYALEEEMSKYMTAMMLTDEWAEEQAMAEEKWEDSVYEDNLAALRKVRCHMPVNIRNMTEEQLTTEPTPNGKQLPKAHARKFKRTNVLQLLRVPPGDIERTHPSILESMPTTGMTLTERRALYEHLKEVGRKWESMKADKSIERKWRWHQSLKTKFKESLSAYDRHVEQYGPKKEPISYDEDYGFTKEAEYESSEATKSKLMDDSGHIPSSATPSRKQSTRGLAGAKSSKAKDEQLMASIRDKLSLHEPESDVDQKLLRELFHSEKRTASLEKQLTQNGLSLPKEEVPYAVAKARVEELTEDLKDLAQKMGAVTDEREMIRLQNEYGKVADEMEKFNSAMMLTKEWAAEQAQKEIEWEAKIRPDNILAIEKIRRHMPVDIRDMSEEELTQIPTPNGKYLPQKIVRKFKRTNILLLLRQDPKSIDPMHPSSLEGMRTAGLTFTERRALHEHLKDLGPKWKTMTSDKMSERKWMWYESLRSKFKEMVDRYQQHIDKNGTSENHPYARADLAIDYSGDYGFPEGPEYLADKVKKSNLLSMEDLERRSEDDDEGGFGFRYKEPEPQTPVNEKKKAPMRMKSGLLRAISAVSPKEDRSPKKKVPSGLMAAIAAKGGDKKPAAPAGLMAAIAAKGGNGDGSKRAAPSGLMAAIAAKGGKAGGGNGDEGKRSAAPAGLMAAIAAKGGTPKSPGEKKRRGGLLAAIASRGKK